MSDLLCSGSVRAASLFDDTAVLAAMIRVESQWLRALITASIAPAGAEECGLGDLVDATDAPGLAAEAEVGGNPVIPLVALLRERLTARNEQAARWLHRGLTSQDVLDTALMLCSRDVLDQVLGDIESSVRTLAALAAVHRRTIMPGRTLGQWAVPISFGVKVAAWLTGVLDAADDLRRVRAELSVQAGGAAGTAAAAAELARDAGLPDPAAVALTLGTRLADDLGLAPRLPWHTARRPVTRLGDALVAVTGSFGRIANDVLVLSRPEIGELREGTSGGSSTMPNKQNPVLSVLVRRAALAAPLLGAQLQLAAAESVDERADGGWHAEWAVLRDLGKGCAVAASQGSDLLAGLVVNANRMAEHTWLASEDLLAERAAVRRSVGADPLRTAEPADYLGAADLIVTAAVRRAEHFTKATA